MSWRVKSTVKSFDGNMCKILYKKKVLYQKMYIGINALKQVVFLFHQNLSVNIELNKVPLYKKVTGVTVTGKGLGKPLCC